MSEPARRTEPLPEFTTEEEAREFWASHDSAPYFKAMEDVTATPPAELRRGPGRGGSRARKRPPAGTMDLVSLRIPAETIAAVKAVAARRRLPYQTLMRSWLQERLALETAGQPDGAQFDLLARVLDTQQEQTALLHAILEQVSSPGVRHAAGAAPPASHEPARGAGERSP